MSNDNYGVLLYGPRYIGTTSFSEALSNASFWVAEGNDLTWDMFKAALSAHQAVPEDKTPSHYVIDKIDGIYDKCIEHICEQEEVDDIHDLDSNKWKLVEDEFTKVLMDFSKLPGIKWYITSEKATEVTNSLYTGTLIKPNLNWLTEKIIPQITQQTLYMGVRQFKRELDDEGKETLIRIKASRVFVCSPLSGILSGDNMGLLPARFPAGLSGEEAVSSYMKFMKGPDDGQS